MRAEMSKTPSRAPSSQLYLPAGFRFCPTDEELVVQYLSKKAALQPFSVPIIAEIELYKFDPWDLPDKALFGEKEWYFFSPRDRKYPNGSRPNRAAGSGYWKATGTDKPISSLSGSKKVGVKKALVFYSGKAPKGVKTNWIMHEYRLAESAPRPGKRKESLRMDDWVLCRIYKKSSSGPKPAKECSDDDSSSLEELLDSLPAMDQSKLTSNILRLHSQNESVAKQQFLITSKNFYEEAQIKSEPTGMAGLEDEKMSQTDGAVQADLFLRDFGCGNKVCEESSQGASSELLDSLPALDQTKLTFNIPTLHLQQESVAKQQFWSYDEGQIKLEPSEMAGVEDEKMSQAEGAVQTELFLRDFGCGNRVCEESSQGAGSSLELSYLSHENSRQQYSPPDSKPEDDSVESTFSSLQSFPSTDRNFDRNFAHPYFGFDSLPSPNLGRFETLPAFSDVDIFSFGI